MDEEAEIFLKVKWLLWGQRQDLTPNVQLQSLDTQALQCSAPSEHPPGIRPLTDDRLRREGGLDPHPSDAGNAGDSHNPVCTAHTRCAMGT